MLQRREHVQAQYRDSSNLESRATLHARFSTHERPWQQWVFDRLPSLDGARVLDVGCGPCWLWRENRDRLPVSATVVASDLSPGMARTAADALGADARFASITSDVQAIPFPGDAFDVVVANHMLYHVPDLDLGLSEIIRVLRPGGTLLAATNGERHMAEVREALGDVAPYIKAFGLESGPERVARHLCDVKVDRRPDVLEVTDPEAVVAYVASMSSVASPVIDALRVRVETAIATDGSFPIHTDGGVITAVKD